LRKWAQPNDAQKNWKITHIIPFICNLVQMIENLKHSTPKFSKLIYFNVISSLKIVNLPTKVGELLWITYFFDCSCSKPWITQKLLDHVFICSSSLAKHSTYETKLLEVHIVTLISQNLKHSTRSSWN
jgi:hypothetical protein